MGNPLAKIGNLARKPGDTFLLGSTNTRDWQVVAPINKDECIKQGWVIITVTLENIDRG